jgi:hypothetical protein
MTDGQAQQRADDLADLRYPSCHCFGRRQPAGLLCLGRG